VREARVGVIALGATATVGGARRSFIMKRIALALALLVIPSTALAQKDEPSAPANAPRARLGEAGTFAISVDASIASSYSSSGSDLVLKPQLDVFVASHLSVGAAVPAALHIPTGRNERSAELSGGPLGLRVGGFFRLSRHVAFWPSAQVGCGSPYYITPGFAPVCRKETLSIGIDPKLVIDPLPYVFLSVSPLSTTFYPGADMGEGTIGPAWITSSIALGGYI
jgi:hypothetical protein